jgi:hypothetical protein
MTTPAQSVQHADSVRPRWQVLLSRTLLRLRLAAAARRGMWALLILAAAYGLFLLTIRLTGLVHWKPEALLLAALPAAALVLGLAWPRRPTLRDAARAVDRQARTEDLFLTMLLLENTPGEYQPLVAAQAEAKAARIRAAEVAPLRINGRLSAICLTFLLCAGLVPFVPQLDPFGRVEAAQVAEKESKKLQETKTATHQRLAEIEKENLSGTESKEVAQALKELKMGLNSSQPKAKSVNAKMLASVQKNIADQWRKISSDKLKDLLSQSSIAQQFGSSAAGEAKKWLEDLQAGSTDSLKKEMKALQQDMEELAKTKDPVKKAQLKQRLRERVDALAQFAKDQTGSKTLAAALKRVQEQMRMAAKAEEEGKPDSSPEAMKAAAESMKLAEKELEQVAQSAKDLKELEKGLAVLQQAKKLNAEEGLDGKKCEGCQSMADYEAMFAKLMKDKGNPDEGGFGDGGQRDEKDSANSKFKTEISKSQVTKGKVLLSLKTKGMGEHVDFKEQYKAAVHDIKQGVSEAIQQEEIPPGYHEGIKSYFESLDEMPKSGK